jgi:hypothetical protein
LNISLLRVVGVGAIFMAAAVALAVFAPARAYL